MTTDGGFLGPAASTPEADGLYDGDLSGLGYVMNLTRLWAQVPATLPALGSLLGQATEAGELTLRQRGVLVTATASALGDSYCSLAWGGKLAESADPAVAAAVLAGTDEGLDPTERALARWARQVVRDPSGTTAQDVQSLRDVGLTEQQIFAVTLFVALRLAFSTVNGALGARPDRQIAEALPPEVRSAVTFGRPVADG